MTQGHGRAVGAGALLVMAAVAATLVGPVSIGASKPASEGHPGTLLYLSNRADPGEYTYDLWTIRSNGKHARQLTHTASPERIGPGQYSIDGQLIGYNDNVNGVGAGGIAVMHADGTHRHLVIPDDGTYGAYSGPSFGPHDEFVFTGLKSTSNDPQEVYLSDKTGTTVKQVTHEEHNVYDAALSRDGKHVVYTARTSDLGPTNIFTIKINGKHRRQLTHSSADSFGQPAFSPDGGTIAFQCGRNTGSPDLNYDICLMRSDGSHQHPLAKTAAFETGPAFSSDGKLIAFASSPTNLDKAGVHEDLFVSNLNGKGRHAVTTDSVSYDHNPAWDPASP